MKALVPETTLPRKTEGSSVDGAHGEPQAVCLEIPVIVETAADAAMGSRPRFLEETRTVLIFPHGAVVRLSTVAQPGDALVVTNRWTRRRVRCRVVHSKTYRNAKGYAEFEFAGPAAGFWGVRFPSEPAGPASETGALLPIAQDWPAPGSHSAPAAGNYPGFAAEAPSAGMEASEAASGSTAAPADASPDSAQDAPGILDELLPVSDAEETAEIEAALASTVITLPGFESAGAVPAVPEPARRGRTQRWILAGVFGCVLCAALAGALVFPWGPAEISGAIEPAPAATLPPPAPAVESAAVTPEAAPPGAAAGQRGPAPEDSQQRAAASREVTSEPERAKMPPLRLAPPTAAPARPAPADFTATPEIRAQLPANTTTGLPGMIPGASSFAPAPPAAREPGRVGGDIEMPRLVSSVPPVYPPLAWQSRVAGDVVVEAVIDEEGRVGGMKVLSGHALLHQAARDALARWRYQPARLNGQPVAVKLQVTIRFRR